MNEDTANKFPMAKTSCSFYTNFYKPVGIETGNPQKLWQKEGKISYHTLSTHGVS